MNDLDFIKEKKGMHCDLCNKKVDLLFGVLTKHQLYQQVCSNCYLSDASR